MKISLSFIAAAILLGGCVNVDYTGQKFAATPLHREVKFFRSRAELPQDGYTIIGRFVITAPEKSDLYTFQKELLERGRAYGGDAVCLVSIEKVHVGAYDRRHEEHGVPPVDAPPPAIEPSQLGARRALVGERTSSIRRRAKALLLKKSDELKRLLE